MPVCRKDGKTILFIHVPKSGGSTLEKVFRDSGYRIHYLDGRMGPGNLNYVRRCTPQHMHREVLESLFRLDRFDAVFMIVRDPLARFKSEYGMRNKTAEIHDSTAFARWTIATLRDYMENSYLYDNHIRPQAQFFVPGARVYMLEDGMDTIVQDLNASLGLDLIPDIPNRRSRQVESGFTSAEIHVTADSVRRIRDFYLEDYRLFGYSDPLGESEASSLASRAHSHTASVLRTSR